MVTKQAMTAVFAGVLVGMDAGDMSKSEPVVRQLWPDELDLAGYEVAAECVVALIGAFGLTTEQIMMVATILKNELDEALA